jgi:hypothetical protein
MTVGVSEEQIESAKSEKKSYTPPSPDELIKKEKSRIEVAKEEPKIRKFGPSPEEKQAERLLRLAKKYDKTNIPVTKKGYQYLEEKIEASDLKDEQKEKELAVLQRMTITNPEEKTLKELLESKKSQQQQAERLFQLAKDLKQEAGVPITSTMYDYLRGKIESSNLVEDQKLSERKALEKYLEVVGEQPKKSKSPDEIMAELKAKSEEEKRKFEKRKVQLKEQLKGEAEKARGEAEERRGEQKRISFEYKHKKPLGAFDEQRKQGTKALDEEIAKTRTSMTEDKKTIGESKEQIGARLEERKDIDQGHEKKPTTFFGRIRKRLPRWLGGKE